MTQEPVTLLSHPECSVPLSALVSAAPACVPVKAPADGLEREALLCFCLSDSCAEEEFRNGTGLTPPEKTALQIPL